MKNNQFLFLLVLTYFALGFVNIHFAILGLVCMMLPFILLFRNRKNLVSRLLPPGQPARQDRQTYFEIFVENASLFYPG